MKTVRPDYYDGFNCLAGNCRNCCCIGWEIDIDEETYDRYRLMPGPDGELIRNAVSGNEVKHFKLNDANRCPFLNDRGLCRLCLKYGEESLCTVCHMYPRFVFLYNQTQELSLSMSCEEAARIIISHTGPVRLLYTEGAGNGTSDTADSSDCEEPFCPDELEAVRDTAILILQDRSRTIEARIYLYLHFCSDIQSLINSEEEYPGTLCRNLPKLTDRYSYDTAAALSGLNKMTPVSHIESFHYFQERLESFSGMEILGDDWKNAFSALSAQWTSVQDAEGYCSCVSAFSVYMRAHCTEYEQLLVYFTTRYFMKSVYDCDLIGKARLTVLSFLAIRDLGAARFISDFGSFSTDDNIEICRIYCEEVEHSEDNLDYLSEEFIFNSLYDTDEMYRQLPIL